MSIHSRSSMLMAPEGDAGGGASWRDALPDDLKVDPNLTKFKTPAELAKSYMEASKLIGSSVRPPGADASPEARKEFIEKMQKAVPELIYVGEGADEVPLWKKLGKPEKPEEYVAEPPVAEAINIEEARNIAQIAGLTKGQFKALTKAMADAKALQTAETNKAKDALKAEWGVAYNDRVQLAAAAAAKLGMGEKQVAAILTGSVPPDQMKFLHAAAVAVGASPREMASSKDGGTGGLTPADARAAIDEMYANRKHPFWDAAHPLHGEALDRMVKLQHMATGASMDATSMYAGGRSA